MKNFAIDYEGSFHYTMYSPPTILRTRYWSMYNLDFFGYERRVTFNRYEGEFIYMVDE